MFLDYARGNLLIDSNYKMEVFGSLRSKFALRN